MDNSASGRTPLWLSVLSVLALIWNLVGLLAVVSQMMTPDSALSELPAEQQAFYRSTPGWVHIAALIAVICGVVGSLGLLMRKRWATTLFIISLLSLLAQQGWLYFGSDFMKVLGVGALGLPLSILIIAIALLLFSLWVTKKGWLR